MAGRSALRARDTLIALRELIDDAIGEIDLYERLKNKVAILMTVCFRRRQPRQAAPTQSRYKVPFYTRSWIGRATHRLAGMIHRTIFRN